AAPLLASTETGEAVPAGHDEAGATHAAPRQSGEQVLGPSRDADVAGACDREAGRLLTVLRGVPEIVAHDPEGGNLPRDPFRPRIQARDALARGDGAAVQRLHHAVAVTETACRLPILDAPAQSSMRLVGQGLQEQRVHRPLEADVQVRDVALGNGDDVDAGERETLEESSRVLLVAA